MNMNDVNLGFSRFLNAMIYETIETSRYEYLCLLRKLATFIQSEFWITFWDDSSTSPALCGSFERGSTKQALSTDLDIATQHPNHFLHVKLHPKPFSKTYRVRFSKLTGPTRQHPTGRGNGSTNQIPEILHLAILLMQLFHMLCPTAIDGCQLLCHTPKLPQNP